MSKKPELKPGKSVKWEDDDDNPKSKFAKKGADDSDDEPPKRKADGKKEEKKSDGKDKKVKKDDDSDVEDKRKHSKRKSDIDSDDEPARKKLDGKKEEKKSDVKDKKGKKDDDSDVEDKRKHSKDQKRKSDIDSDDEHAKKKPDGKKAKKGEESDVEGKKKRSKSKDKKGKSDIDSDDEPPKKKTDAKKGEKKGDSKDKRGRKGEESDVEGKKKRSKSKDKKGKSDIDSDGESPRKKSTGKKGEKKSKGKDKKGKKGHDSDDDKKKNGKKSARGDDSDDELKKKFSKDKKRKSDIDSDDEPAKKKLDGKKEEKKSDEKGDPKKTSDSKTEAKKDAKTPRKDEDSDLDDLDRIAKEIKKDREKKGDGKDKKGKKDEDSDDDLKKKASGKTTDREHSKKKGADSSDDKKAAKDKKKKGGKDSDSSDDEKGKKGAKKTVKDKDRKDSKRGKDSSDSSDDEKRKKGAKKSAKAKKGGKDTSSDSSDDEKKKKKKKVKLFQTGIDDFDEFEDEEPEKPVVPHYHEDYFVRKMKLIDTHSVEKAKKIIDRTAEMMMGRVLERSVKFADQPKRMDKLIKEFEFPDYDRRALNNLYYSGMVAELKPSKLEKAGFATMNAKHNTLKGILLGDIKIGPVKKNLDELIFEVKFPQYEEEMKKAKLKDYERKQKELQEKLKEMNVNIDLLKYEEENFFADKESKPHRKPKEWTQKQAENFVKKVEKERIELAQRRRKRFKERQEEIAEIEEEERKKEEEREEKNDEKRQVLRDQRKALKAKKKAWKKEMSRWEEEYQEKLEGLYHFPKEKLEEFEEGEEERKEEELERIRELHRPMDYDDLREWERDYMEMVNERRQKMEDERVEKPAIAWMDKKKAGAFESGFLGFFKEEKNKMASLDREKASKARESMDRRNEFAARVKSSFLPGIDETKRLELRRSIEKQGEKKGKKKKRDRSRSAEGSRSRSGSRSESEERDPRKIGNDYLKEAREMARKDREAQGGVTRSLNVGREEGYESSQTGLRKKLTVTKHDYLTDMRKQHDFRTPQQSEWERIARKSDMTERDKRLMVRLQAEKMEDAAKMRERFIRNNKKLADDRKIEELDEMYLTSIKAKLALLQADPLGDQSWGGQGMGRGRGGIEGTLQIVIVKGINLKDMDFVGKSDAFAVVLFGNKEVGRTQTIESSNPEWKKTITVPLNAADEASLPKLRIEVRDDDVGSDDLIGTVELDLLQCLREPGLWAINDELPLHSESGAKGANGRIQLQVAFTPKLGKDGKGIRPGKLTELIEGTLTLNVGKGTNIKSMDTFGKSDAFVVALFGEKAIGKTKVIASANPEWNEQFTFEVSVEDNKVPALRLEVRDEDVGNDDLIGVIAIDFMKLVRNPFVTALNESAPVIDPTSKAVHGQVQIKASFAPKKGKNEGRVDRKGTVGKSQEDLMKAEGTITVVIGKGEKIKSMDTFGKSDAYCKVVLGDAEVGRSKVVTSADPVWNDTITHTFTYDLTSIPKFRIEVLDKDTLSDDFIGSFELDLSKCIRNPGMTAINEVFAVIDPKKPKEVNGKVGVQVTFTATKGKNVQEPVRLDNKKSTMIKTREDEPVKVEGVITVAIKKGEKIKSMDTFGNSDAYCKVVLADAEVGRSKVIASTNPEWNDVITHAFAYDAHHIPNLRIEVLDKDTLSDDLIGSFELDLIKCMRNPGVMAINETFSVIDPKKPKDVNGKVTVQVTYSAAKGKNVQEPVRLDNKKSTMIKTREEEPVKYEGVFTVAIKKGEKIKSMDTFGNSDAYCKVVFADAEVGRSKVVTSANPEWNDVITHAFAYDVNNIPNLRIEVMDKDTLSDDFIGSFELDLIKCMRNPGVMAINETFSVIDPQKPKEVNGKVTVQVTFSSKGKAPLPSGESPVNAKKKSMVIDANNGKQSGIQQPQEDMRQSQKVGVRTDAEPKPAMRAPKMVNGQLNIMIVKAEGLKKADTFGSSDAYTVIKLQGKEVGKTGVITSLNPVWKAPFNVPLSFEEGVPPTIEFTVLDQDTFGSDKLGELSISAKDIIRSPGFFSVNGFFELLDPETKKTGKAGKIYLQVAFVPQGSNAKLSWPAAP